MSCCQTTSTNYVPVLPIKPVEEPSTGGLNGRNITKKSRCCLIVVVKKILALLKAVVLFPIKIFKRKAKVAKDETASKIETLPRKTETLPKPSITPTAQPVPVKQLNPEQIAKEYEFVDKLNSGNEYIQPRYLANIAWDEFLDRQGARLNKFIFFSASLNVANRLLAKCPNVNEVSILASAFSEEVINLKPILEKLKSLRELYLTFEGVFYNRDTPHLAEALKSLNNLEDLKIGGVRQKGGGGLQSIIASLNHLPHLKTLAFTDSALSLVEATDLHNKVLALRNLNELSFEKMYINEEQSVDVLFQALEASSIRSLTFSQSDHGDRVVALLMKQPQLLQNLRHLKLSRCKLSQSSFRLLVEHFKEMPNLIFLNLQECFPLPSVEEKEDEGILDSDELNERVRAKRERHQQEALEIKRMILESESVLPCLKELLL